MVVRPSVFLIDPIVRYQGYALSADGPIKSRAYARAHHTCPSSVTDG